MRPGRLVPAPPITPGHVLRRRILEECGITQDELAEAMDVSRFSVNQIVNGRRAITADMALRLSHATSTTPDFWLNLQRDVDVYAARLRLGESLKRLKILRPPKSKTELFEFRD